MIERIIRALTHNPLAVGRVLYKTIMAHKERSGNKFSQHHILQPGYNSSQFVEGISNA
jgi:hypothetical protein